MANNDVRLAAYIVPTADAHNVSFQHEYVMSIIYQTSAMKSYILTG